MERKRERVPEEKQKIGRHQNNRRICLGRESRNKKNIVTIKREKEGDRELQSESSRRRGDSATLSKVRMASLRLGVEMMFYAQEVEVAAWEGHPGSLARQLLGGIHPKVSPKSIIKESSIGIHEDDLVTFCQEWVEGLTTTITDIFLPCF